MHWFLDLNFNIGMAVGPVLGFIYQYYLIKKRKSVGSFSINICGILLFCNILRIGFYLFKQYAIALLIQSILMILAQLLLLSKCVQIMKQEGLFESPQSEQDQQTSGLFKNFWRWDKFSTYLLVIIVFATFVATVSYTFNYFQLSIVGEVLGYMSTISESVIMVPQVIQNQRQRRVKGLSHLLVALNNIGDCFKLIFFVINNQPLQFIICGVIQVFVDGYIVIQIFYFGNGEVKKVQSKVEQKAEGSQKKEPTDQKFVQLVQQSPIIQPTEDYKQFQDQIE